MTEGLAVYSEVEKNKSSYAFSNIILLKYEHFVQPVCAINFLLIHVYKVMYIRPEGNTKVSVSTQVD